MFRIVLSILILLISFSLFLGVHAACQNEGDMTKDNFKINLGCIDPVNAGNNISGQSGITVLETLLGNLADIFLFTIPIIAAISFLAAGYFYIFSAGDSEKTTKAKTIIKWNIIAIIVALLSYGIIKLIAELFT